MPPGRAVDTGGTYLAGEVVQDMSDVDEPGMERIARHRLPVDGDDVRGSVEVVVVLPAGWSGRPERVTGVDDRDSDLVLGDEIEQGLYQPDVHLPALEIEPRVLLGLAGRHCQKLAMPGEQ